MATGGIGVVVLPVLLAGWRSAPASWGFRSARRGGRAARHGEGGGGRTALCGRPAKQRHHCPSVRDRIQHARGVDAAGRLAPFQQQAGHRGVTAQAHKIRAFYPERTVVSPGRPAFAVRWPAHRGRCSSADRAGYVGFLDVSVWFSPRSSSAFPPSATTALTSGAPSTAARSSATPAPRRPGAAGSAPAGPAA
jgi:hypothetical protein